MAGTGVKLGLACLLAEIPLAGPPPSGATSSLLTSSGEGLVSSGRASFSVTFKQQVNPYPVLGLFVMPGEQVPLQVLADSARSYTIAAGGGGRIFSKSFKSMAILPNLAGRSSCSESSNWREGLNARRHF